MKLKEHIADNGNVLLYRGKPDLALLNRLAEGPGDLWHSSADQGYGDAFPELVYQTAVFWWFLNHFKGLNRCVSWRINPQAFVVRKEVWEIFNGFPSGYESPVMSAFDLGYRLLRHGGGVPLYIKGLFPKEDNQLTISAIDRYTFFRKNFKEEHSLYMLMKEGRSHLLKEWKSYLTVKKQNPVKNDFPVVPPRKIKEVEGNPSVSVIIPTMYRQEYTKQLLDDYSEQSYPVNEIIVIDATPEEVRDESIYREEGYQFELRVVWQRSSGSSKARNEAIEMCRGEYIIFADDDTRIFPDFVEKHLCFLQTYHVEACNGMDIQAKYHREGLQDLSRKLEALGNDRWKAGAAHSFSNANSCVKTEWVKKLIGNDINFDGGYGEDSDFGLRIWKEGGMVLYNPYSVNLHLKPPAGGYRHWNLQASVLGKKRKKQAWELEQPVRFIKPVPSPTVLYGINKHYPGYQVTEYRSKYFFLYLFKGAKMKFPLRLLKLPLKYLQFRRSAFYAENLMKRGERF